MSRSCAYAGEYIAEGIRGVLYGIPEGKSSIVLYEQFGGVEVQISESRVLASRALCRYSGEEQAKDCRNPAQQAVQGFALLRHPNGCCARSTMKTTAGASRSASCACKAGARRSADESARNHSKLKRSRVDLLHIA